MKKTEMFTATILTLPLLFGAAGCKSADKMKDKATSAASSATSTMKNEGSSTTSDGATPAGVLEDPFKRGGNYYSVLGTAVFDNMCNIKVGADGKSVYNYMGVMNGAGQVGAACGKITGKVKRVDPVDDPAGFTKNAKATIPSVKPGGHAYNGFFYNRSHMISAVLGGDPHAKNLITGTRMQNVGEGNIGGMRYTEIQAEKYVASAVAKTCPLTYEVKPHYRNTTDAVPTWVEVNMQSCDKKINERVAVFNDAAGYSIDYATGVWKKN